MFNRMKEVVETPTYLSICGFVRLFVFVSYSLFVCFCFLLVYWFVGFCLENDNNKKKHIPSGQRGGGNGEQPHIQATNRLYIREQGGQHHRHLCIQERHP